MTEDNSEKQKDMPDSVYDDSWMNEKDRLERACLGDIKRNFPWTDKETDRIINPDPKTLRKEVWEKGKSMTRDEAIDEINSQLDWMLKLHDNPATMRKIELLSAYQFCMSPHVPAGVLFDNIPMDDSLISLRQKNDCYDESEKTVDAKAFAVPRSLVYRDGKPFFPEGFYESRFKSAAKGYHIPERLPCKDDFIWLAVDLSYPKATNYLFLIGEDKAGQCHLIPFHRTLRSSEDGNPTLTLNQLVGVICEFNKESFPEAAEALSTVFEYSRKDFEVEGKRTRRKSLDIIVPTAVKMDNSALGRIVSSGRGGNDILQNHGKGKTVYASFTLRKRENDRSELTSTFSAEDQDTRELLQLGYKCSLPKLFAYLTPLLENAKTVNLTDEQLTQIIRGKTVRRGSLEWEDTIKSIILMHSLVLYMEGDAAVDLIKKKMSSDPGFSTFEKTLRVDSKVTFFSLCNCTITKNEIPDGEVYYQFSFTEPPISFKVAESLNQLLPVKENFLSADTGKKYSRRAEIVKATLQEKVGAVVNGILWKDSFTIKEFLLDCSFPESEMKDMKQKFTPVIITLLEGYKEKGIIKDYETTLSSQHAVESVRIIAPENSPRYKKETKKLNKSAQEEKQRKSREKKQTKSKTV